VFEVGLTEPAVFLLLGRNPLSHFFAVNGHVPRSFDSDPNLHATDGRDGDANVVANDNGLANSSGQK
jgi:hypothetical protein